MSARRTFMGIAYAMTIGCSANRPPTPPTQGPTAGVATCAPLPTSFPAPSRVDLDKHDLRWIGCDHVQCSSTPDCPLARQTLPSAVDDLTFIGQVHSNDSGAFTTQGVITSSNISWINDRFFTYRIGNRLFVQTRGDDYRDQLNVYYAARAFKILEGRFPTAFKQLISDTASPPGAPVLGTTSWKNSFAAIVVSFNDSPSQIASSVTVLDAAPVTTGTPPVNWSRNTVVLSIHSKTILGADLNNGTRPLYGLPSDDENWLAYMREGLADTVVHEMLHRYIDYANSVDQRMNNLAFRPRMGKCASAIEEVLVASTSLPLFEKKKAFQHTKYFSYYQTVLDTNWATIKKECGGQPNWLDDLGAEADPAAHYSRPMLSF